MKQLLIADDTVMTPDEVVSWLKLDLKADGKKKTPSAGRRELQRLGVPCLALGHKTLRYLRSDVLRWLQEQRPSPRLHTRKAS